MDVEISVAWIALVVVTLGFFLIYVQRANLAKKFDSFRVETEAHHQASYGMAKHIRYLQLQAEGLNEAEASNADPESGEESRDESRYRSQADKPRGRRSVSAGMIADIADFRSPNDVTNNDEPTYSSLGSGELDSAVERLFSEGADARRLSEALGVSRSEAEIIAHIGPQHRSRA
jgi:hypothetical protein